MVIYAINCYVKIFNIGSNKLLVVGTFIKVYIFLHLLKNIIKSRKKYEHMYYGMLYANMSFRDEKTTNMINNTAVNR